MSSEAVRISIAIVTRNRPDSLRRCLSSLFAQEERPFEVVVSDDSDRDAYATQEVAAAFGVRYLKGPRRGLYANRNFAAAHCLGSHLRTMDDDHEFPNGHLRVVRTSVESDPNAVWTGAERTPKDDPFEPPRYPGELHPGGFSFVPKQTEPRITIADGFTVYPRWLFQRGVCYYDGFLFGAAYLEFGCRLRWLGLQIRKILDTFLIHHHDPLNRSVMSDRVQRASQSFAGYLLAFLCKPSLRNKTLWLAHRLIQARKQPIVAIQDAISGMRHAQRFKRDILNQHRAVQFRF